MQPRTLWVKRDAGEATPAGWFLAYVIESPFCGGFLVLTTFVVEPAVYNFMQTQKERKPCKIKASAANKRSARRRTRSGGPRTARTGAERRHRTFEPWQGSKKRTIPIWYRSFFHESARRRTRSGGPRPARTGAERRHRTFEPWQGSKIKERYHSVSFFYS